MRINRSSSVGRDAATLAANRGHDWEHVLGNETEDAIPRCPTPPAISNHQFPSVRSAAKARLLLTCLSKDQGNTYSLKVACLSPRLYTFQNKSTVYFAYVLRKIHRAWCSVGYCNNIFKSKGITRNGDRYRRLTVDRGRESKAIQQTYDATARYRWESTHPHIQVSFFRRTLLSNSSSS
jgi:hypothetical protein